MVGLGRADGNQVRVIVRLVIAVVVVVAVVAIVVVVAIAVVVIAAVVVVIVVVIVIAVLVVIAIVEHVGGGRGGKGAGCGSEALLLELVAVLWRSRSVSL